MDENSAYSSPYNMEMYETRDFDTPQREYDLAIPPEHLLPPLFDDEGYNPLSPPPSASTYVNVSTTQPKFSLPAAVGSDGLVQMNPEPPVDMVLGLPNDASSSRSAPHVHNGSFQLNPVDPPAPQLEKGNILVDDNTVPDNTFSAANHFVYPPVHVNTPSAEPETWVETVAQQQSPQVDAQVAATTTTPNLTPQPDPITSSTHPSCFSPPVSNTTRVPTGKSHNNNECNDAETPGKLDASPKKNKRSASTGKGSTKKSKTEATTVTATLPPLKTTTQPLLNLDNVSQTLPAVATTTQVAPQVEWPHEADVDPDTSSGPRPKIARHVPRLAALCARTLGWRLTMDKPESWFNCMWHFVDKDGEACDVPIDGKEFCDNPFMVNLKKPHWRTGPDNLVLCNKHGLSHKYWDPENHGVLLEKRRARHARAVEEKRKEEALRRMAVQYALECGLVLIC